jgi:hypothetical protein
MIDGSVNLVNYPRGQKRTRTCEGDYLGSRVDIVGIGVYPEQTQPPRSALKIRWSHLAAAA